MVDLHQNRKLGSLLGQRSTIPNKYIDLMNFVDTPLKSSNLSVSIDKFDDIDKASICIAMKKFKSMGPKEWYTSGINKVSTVIEAASKQQYARNPVSKNSSNTLHKMKKAWYSRNAERCISAVDRKNLKLTPILKSTEFVGSKSPKKRKKTTGSRYLMNLIIRNSTFYFPSVFEVSLDENVRKLVNNETTKDEYLILNKNVKLKHKHDIWEPFIRWEEYKQLFLHNKGYSDLLIILIYSRPSLNSLVLFGRELLEIYTESVLQLTKNIPYIYHSDGKLQVKRSI